MQGVASGSWPALAGAPTIGTATAGALSASVAFTAPTYTGSGITGYTATSSPGGITGTGASSPVTVSGLTAGTAYTFTVTATTAAGQSSASAASNSVTPTAPPYIEDVFSTYLYTGNGSTQTITNNIDLSGQGGLVWIKSRASGSYDHQFVDTTRGSNKYINSNNTNAETTNTNRLTAFNTDGFALGASAQVNEAPASGYAATYASWTFREAPKFFDVVTWSGNGTIGRTISHSLGSVPGCIIVKKTNSASSSDWVVYHRSLGATKAMILNLTDSVYTWSVWNDTAPTSTVFSLNDASEVNGAGNSYVAYLFAHNAGGFGLTGTDNVISCGSFTTDGSGNATVNLGYEPQFLIHKATTGSESWLMLDTMRGWNMSTADRDLFCNSASAEASGNYGDPTSTGFTAAGLSATRTYIYIAIRRGPMKVPTSGTSVFSPVAQTNTGSQPFPVTAGFPVDSAWFGQRNGWGVNFITSDRLRGATNLLLTTSTNSEATNNSTYGPSVSRLDSNTQFKDGMTNASEPDIYWMYRRAPSFFDEVCYTGTSVAQALTHNLGAVPEMMIVKRRDSATAGSWFVYTSFIGNNGYLALNDTTAADYWINIWNDTTPTSTQFTVGSYLSQSAGTYVAYLFSTCAGVSKVGSYTGTATTKQIDCGFTGGARFVLIKRTDSTGDWYVWDSARGIVSGNDPYLLLNSTAAEVTNTDYVDTYSAGFEISSTAPAAINASGGTFIFLAIA